MSAYIYRDADGLLRTMIAVRMTKQKLGRVLDLVTEEATHLLIFFCFAQTETTDHMHAATHAEVEEHVRRHSMQKLDDSAAVAYGERANLLMRHARNILDQLVDS